MSFVNSSALVCSNHKDARSHCVLCVSAVWVGRRYARALYTFLTRLGSTCTRVYVQYCMDYYVELTPAYLHLGVDSVTHSLRMIVLCKRKQALPHAHDAVPPEPQSPVSSCDDRPRNGLETKIRPYSCTKTCSHTCTRTPGFQIEIPWCRVFLPIIHE